MPGTSSARITRAFVILALAAGLLAGTGAPTEASAARRLPQNTTGIAAGSEGNGTGNLKTSLAVLPDGRLQIAWVPWTKKTRTIRKFIVKVGVNRSLDVKVSSYTYGRRKRSTVVAPAYGASPASGNFSFVKVIMVMRNGHTSGSPTKWIKAPVPATCTASAAHQVTVGTFNVRQWALDNNGSAAFKWTVRGPRVVSQILASGARVVAVQEASGMGNVGYGPDRQWKWILDHLNAADPTHHWVDAVGDLPYTVYGGLVGTRVFYDATKYVQLDAGHLTSLGDTSLLAWTRLQDLSLTQPAFTFAATHLKVGETTAGFTSRGKQVAKAISTLKAQQAVYPNEQVIIAGDMNSTNNTKPYNNVQALLLGAGFYDSFATLNTPNSRYPTTSSFKWPVKASPSRRDYIMSLGPVKGSCASINRFYASASQAASDHFMQVAVLPLATS